MNSLQQTTENRIADVVSRASGSACPRRRDFPTHLGTRGSRGEATHFNWHGATRTPWISRRRDFPLLFNLDLEETIKIRTRVPHERKRSAINSPLTTREIRHGEKGAGIVEALIGLLMFTIVALAAGQLLRAHVNPLLMSERQRQADKQAESLLNDLGSRSGTSLTDGGSFATDATGNPILNEDGSISLSCSTTYCDQIIATPQSTSTELILSQAAWSPNPPSGGQQVYLRAWAIGTADSGRGLRRISVAIFPGGGATQPLTVQTINVVLH